MPQFHRTEAARSPLEEEPEAAEWRKIGAEQAMSASSERVAKKSIFERLKWFFSGALISLAAVFSGGPAPLPPPPLANVTTTLEPMNVQIAVKTAEHDTAGDMRPPPSPSEAAGYVFGGGGGASASTPPQSEPFLDETMDYHFQLSERLRYSLSGFRSAPIAGESQTALQDLWSAQSQTAPQDLQPPPVVVALVEQIAQSQPHPVSAQNKEQATRDNERAKSFLSEVLDDAAQKLEEPQTFADILIEAFVLDKLKDFLSDTVKKLSSGVISKAEAAARLAAAYFLERVRSETEQNQNPYLVPVRSMLEKILELTAEKGACTSITAGELAQRCSCGEEVAGAFLQLLTAAQKHPTS